jgi:tetratricopeptide (TPR) repeat protein
MRGFAVESTVDRKAASVSAVFFFILVAATGTAAQRTPGGAPSVPTGPSGTGGLPLETNARGSVVVRVLGAHNAPLLQQAFVRIFESGSSVPLMTRVTSGPAEASFNNLPGLGRYVVEVSAAGYRTQRKEFDYSGNPSFNEMDVRLEPDTDDGSVSYTLPHNLPVKAQKHVEKGVAEFRVGNLKVARKELTAAYNDAPETVETNYLLGSLYLRTKNLEQAEKYLSSAVSIDATDVPALVGLGHVRFEKEDLKGATDVLEKAITLDGKEWDALWLLSEIHLHEREFEKAAVESERAVELGKGAANGAEFVEGEALAELGRKEEALKTLQAFLRDVPTDPNAPAARELVGRLDMETPMKAPSPEALGPVLSSTSPAASPVLQLPAPQLQVSVPKLPLPDWEPAGVDEGKPSVADGVTCPADEVIAEAGKRVTVFVDGVNRIEAREEVTHEELSTLGRPVKTEKRKFQYMIYITDSEAGVPAIEENWNGDLGLNPFLGRISMFGLADLPLIFHPSVRSDFHLTCEGLGKWREQATWIVYFRQRPDRPERLRSYGLSGGSSYSVGLKGRAWISADTYQILRIEANLMKPVPQIGLGSEEDVIEYGSVPFRTKNTLLWLPTSADIYFYFRHRPFHRHHTFTNYSLFSVSASQKIGEPTAAEDKQDRK